jgi:hypothetical protein
MMKINFGNGSDYGLGDNFSSYSISLDDGMTKSKDYKRPLTDEERSELDEFFGIMQDVFGLFGDQEKPEPDDQDKTAEPVEQTEEVVSGLRGVREVRGIEEETFEVPPFIVYAVYANGKLTYLYRDYSEADNAYHELEDLGVEPSISTLTVL